MIPPNADKIIEARLKGFRPAAMVIVTLGEGPSGIDNPIVPVRLGIAYDWRWVRGLEVCLYVNDADEWPVLLEDIAKQQPEYLGLWNYESRWGTDVYYFPTLDTVDRPPRQWRRELDFLPWMDFQNKDFIERRRYERDGNGIPYAI